MRVSSRVINQGQNRNRRAHYTWLEEISTPRHLPFLPANGQNSGAEFQDGLPGSRDNMSKNSRSRCRNSLPRSRNGVSAFRNSLSDHCGFIFRPPPSPLASPPEHLRHRKSPLRAPPPALCVGKSGLQLPPSLPHPPPKLLNRVKFGNRRSAKRSSGAAIDSSPAEIDALQTPTVPFREKTV